ncbi:MAG: patatin-like phospholipase family protein [Candidatus Cloacimonadota bacterium]|nr:patatin-like phospholipase family protein [Candidatus Cloacimonadota bacterium]
MNLFKKLQSLRKKKIGLALGGGGAKGYSHIAFLQVLDELEIQPSMVAGTSIGALIGALYCSGTPADKLAELFPKPKITEYSALVDLSLFPKHGFVKGDKIIEYFKKKVGIENFAKLKIPLKVVATDFWKMEEKVFQTGNLGEAVRASISIPGIFEPIKINDHIYVDGGVTNPLPYDLLQKECDLVIAIDVTGHIDKNNQEIPSIFESIFTSFQIMQDSLIDAKLEAAKPDIFMQPKLENFNILDFHLLQDILESVKPDIEKFREKIKNLK